MREFILFSLAVAALVCGQDFAFPETSHQRLDEAEDSKRTPLFVPDRCPENQLLYPGDQEADWICDCAPGFVYYPPKDGCFAAYRQGPCPNGTHLVIKKSEVIPSCVANPCGIDGKVRYHGKCYSLDKPGGPCKPIEESGGIFGVNATTLNLECLKGTDRLSLFQFPAKCPPGSRRDNTNSCREVFG